MKRLFSTVAVAVVVGVFYAGFLAAEETPAKDADVDLKVQTKCAVMGGNIKKKHFTDVAGQRIYVCCPMCIKKITADPEAALKNIAKHNEFAESLQKTCIVSGEKLEDMTKFVDFAGRRLYACCNHCIKKINKDPAKFAKKLTEQAEKAAKKSTGGTKQDGKKEGKKEEKKDDHAGHNHAH